MVHAIRKGECQSRPKNIRHWDGLSATANLAVQREVPEGRASPSALSCLPQRCAIKTADALFLEIPKK